MPDKDAELRALRDEYHTLCQNAALGDEDVEALGKRCRELIYHVHDRIQYAEGRRAQMATVALYLLAGALALVAATFTEVMSGCATSMSLLRFTSLAMFLTSLVTLTLYAQQTNYSYPFVGATKTSFWFYHYCISSDYRVPRIPFAEKKSAKLDMRVIHMRDMLAYARATLTSTSRDRLEQDLEQLFLLIANEKYKNAQLTHLRTALSIGLPVIVGLAGAAVIVAIVNC